MKLFRFNKPASTNDEGILKFKTNIKCGGCIANVKPHLDGASGIESWEVNTEHPDKILTVKSSGISPESIEQLVRNAGYKIEQI